MPPLKPPMAEAKVESTFQLGAIGVPPGVVRPDCIACAVTSMNTSSTSSSTPSRVTPRTLILRIAATVACWIVALVTPRSPALSSASVTSLRSAIEMAPRSVTAMGPAATKEVPKVKNAARTIANSSMTAIQNAMLIVYFVY